MKKWVLLFWLFSVVQTPLYVGREWFYPYDTERECEAGRIEQIAKDVPNEQVSPCAENKVYCWMPSNGQPPRKP